MDICVICDCSLRGDCYNQVDKIESVVVSQPLFQATAMLAQWAPEFSDRDGGSTRVQNGPPPTKHNLPTTTAER